MTDLMTELTKISKSNFRFQNQKALLTYKTHCDKKDLKKFLKCIARDKSEKFNSDKFKCYIAHENGDNDKETPYEHTHVVVDFSYAVQSKKARFLDYEDIHPHISVIKNKREWMKACKYICKEDTTVKLKKEDAFKEDEMEVTEVWKHNSIPEMLGDLTKFTDVSGAIQVMKYKPRNMPTPKITEESFYPWQRKIWNMCVGEPDGRKITWIYDRTGGTGKTRFAQWGCLIHPDKCMMMNNIGRIADFANNWKNKEESGWRGNTVFINLSRSYSDREQIYEALEMVADGFLTCTKYMGGEIWLPDMHVIVLANFDPIIDKLSLDRWNINKIEELDLRPRNISGGARKRFNMQASPGVEPQSPLAPSLRYASTITQEEEEEIEEEIKKITEE